jgi:hypothetical protein
MGRIFNREVEGGGIGRNTASGLKSPVFISEALMYGLKPVPFKLTHNQVAQ